MPEAHNPTQSIGEVVALEGTAQAVSESGTRMLEPGDPVFEGETLITSGASSLEVRFLDDTSLSQGENSRIDLDSYVYDPDTPSNSGLLLEMGTGVFRTVTGEIAEQNPDNFKLKSPQALIGIRGTTVVSEVREFFEKHGAEDISEGKMLVVQDNFGNIRFISQPKQIIDFYENQPIQEPRPLTTQELEYFQSNAPITLGGTKDTGTEEDVEKEAEDQKEQEEAEEEKEEAEDDGGEKESESPPGSENGEDTSEQDDASLFDSAQDSEQSQPGESQILGVIDVSNPEEPFFYAAANQEATETEETEPVTGTGEIDGNLNKDELKDYIEEDDGEPAGKSITGTNTDDTLYGGDDNDTIKGMDGDDTIYGEGGDDHLEGGAGADTLYGGDGNDEIHSDSPGANDFLYGESGDDTLIALGGDDTLEGGGGNDTLQGGNDNDSLMGGAGQDILQGESGNDKLDGGIGADKLYGGTGEDHLTYDAQDIVIDGGEDQDVLEVPGAGITLDLNASGQVDIQGIEKIDIKGTGNNQVQLSTQDLLDLSPTTNKLYIDGNHDDSVTLIDGTWTEAGQSDMYRGLSNGSAELWVHQDVTVNLYNDEEVLSTNTGATVDEDSTGNVITTAMLATTDVDNTDAELVYTVDVVPNNGTLRLNGTALNATDSFTQADINAGDVSYDHDGSQTSSDSFDFTVDDGEGTTTSGNFSWTVNNVNDAAVADFIEGTALTFTENDGPMAVTSTLALSDVDDTNLESAVVQISGNYQSGEDELAFTNQNGISGNWNSTNGTLTLTGTATTAQYETALRSITYENTSDNPSTANRIISFTVNDGDVDSNTQARDISITSINDDPVNAGSLPSDITVTEDVSSNVDLSAIDLSDVDASGGDLSVTLRTSNGGNLSATSGGGVTVSDSGTESLALTGTQADLNTFLDTASNLTYLHGTQHTNGNDADTISVTVNDNGNTGTDGGTDINLGTVNVDITPVNDMPIAVDDEMSTDEDSAITVANTLLTANDSDPDAGDTLSVTGIDSATIGLVTDNGDGTFTYDPNGQFESLAVGETATDSFAYTISDGQRGTDTATVTVTVNGVNDSPTAANDAVSTDEDSSITTSNLLLAANDSDPDSSDALSVTGLDDSATTGQVTDNGDGTFTYDPNGQFESLAVGETETDTFAYTISDGQGGNDTVTVTVNGLHDNLVTTGAHFNTIYGTNILNELQATDADDTVEIAAAAQNVTGGIEADTMLIGSYSVTGSLDGGDHSASGGDTLLMGDGADISAGTVTNFEILLLDQSATATMNISQHNAFTNFVDVPDQTIRLSNSGTLTGNGGIETYYLADGGGNNFTAATGGQTVLGGNGADVITGSDGADTMTGGAGADILKGGGGNDVFGLNTGDASDIIKDFDQSSDVLRFDETSLGFNAQGSYEFWHASSTDQHDPTVKQTIGVLDQAANDWSDVAQVMENTLSSFGNGTNDDTYFVVSNGSDARVYYWDGDTDGGSDVDGSELTHFADLQGITETDIEDMDVGTDAPNFEIIQAT